MTLTANLPRWARFAGLRGQAIPVSVAALLVGSMLITAVSLYGATSATDAIALGRQSEGIIRAIRHKTLSLARELKMQTVWSEAFQHTVVAPDPVWMRQLFGEYLTSLLGYDGIYVLDPAGTPMMTFPGAPDSYAHAVAPVIGDLVDAVTRDTEGPLASFVERSRVAMGGGQSVEHRAIGDVRAIGDDIAIVLVETIVPDSWPAGGLRPPALMVALYHLDPAAMGELGGVFDYRNIVLLPGRSAEGVIDLRTLDGRKVGALSWEVRRPGTAIIGRMAWGLGLSVLLLLALGWAVLRIVDRQTRTIMAAERRVFEAEARRTRDRIAEQERNLAHAAFVSDTVAHFDAEMIALAADMEQAIAGLERSATSIVTESELTRRETERISEVVAAASACSATVAQAAEHLTRSVAAVRRAASNTARISNHAVSQATDIQVQMKALASATSEINQVVKLIGSIADQTNLLALNATIEAARAGAAGRGFAVVASEVKSLAGATGQAADDVGRQILAVQERTAGAIEAMRGILSVISQMTIVSDEVGSALADQDEVAGALIESSEGMASSMDLVVSSIAAVQEASSSAHRSARTVTSSADAVAASTERFGGTVRSLIRRVAAS